MNTFDNANLIARRSLRIAWVWIFLAMFVALPVVLWGGSEGEIVAATVKTAFGKDCETMLIKETSTAKEEILVAIYSLTRRNINSALVRAVKRGVKVTLKYDLGQSDLDAMKEAVDYLKTHGVECIPVKMSDERATMHHKFMVIDRKRVLTGSYNYTSPASTINYENLVVIDSAETATAFVKEFERIKDK